MKIHLLKYLLLTIVVASLVSAFAQTERAAWQTMELINAKTGEIFTLGGFEDKLVYVEPMATWCSNCRAQLKNVSELQSKVEKDVIFVALSLEGNIANEKLAAYAEKEGFEFIFAKTTQELLRALVADFGRGVSSPPSTPHFIIARDGKVSEMVLGRESADDLLAQIDSIRNGN